jgi:hypothetical protein
MKTNIKYEIKDKEIIGTGTYKDLLRDIEDARKRTWNTSDNRKQFETFTTNKDRNHSSFAGGSWEDVTNLKNMSSFKKQLEEFKRNKLEEQISTKIDYSPKRTRRLSEHDGDYDHDKQWDIKPFTNSKKELLPISVIDVNVDMSISAGMSSESINKYGALVWSIIQLIESLGIQANIYIKNEVNRIDSNGNYSSNLNYRIKKAGEYISPVALATCFQSVFFRRAMFSGMVLACDNNFKQACYSLGSPKVKRTDKHVWFENGAIYTRAGGSFNAKEVEESILKLVSRV